MSHFRSWLRRLLFGLSTVTGLAPRGFFIPYRYAGKTRSAGARPPYPEVEALFAEAEPGFLKVLELLEQQQAALLAIGQEPPPEPRWTQSWFPRLDAAVAYCMTRHFAPARILEVGAGHSTRFYARALADGGLAGRITTIDPAPRADLANLPVTLLRRTLQEAGPAPFRELRSGDLLSLDSSHILLPGTDLDDFYGRILPHLPAGLLLQIHDIFLPDDYPAHWAWRGYNEQLAVLGLLYSGGWEPLWSSHYVATRLRSTATSGVAGKLPLPEGALESSLWLRRRGSATLTEI